MNASRHLAEDFPVPILVAACDGHDHQCSDRAFLGRSCIRYSSIKTASESLTENIRAAGHCNDDPRAA
jgi:hypothetical protein